MTKSIDQEEFLIIDPIKYNRYGCNNDCKDKRDFQYTPQKEICLERIFTLCKKMPPILNQGKLGSCAINSICNVIRYCEMIEDKDYSKQLSSLFVYYNVRNMEGNVNEDSGAQIRNVLKSINTHGACYEKTWPNNITQFAEKPTPSCYKEGKDHRTIRYERITQDITHIKYAIQSGFPVVFGLSVFESIEQKSVIKFGIIPFPLNGSKKIGNHCAICCGWDDSRRLFTIMNSWGTNWGDNGYGYISYDYLSNPNFARDFWKINFI